jgi:serine/threonine protein kinase
MPAWLQKKPRNSVHVQKTEVLKLEDFQLGKVLGGGRFGTVLQAIHKKTNTLYALKRIPKKIIEDNLLINQFTL